MRNKIFSLLVVLFIFVGVQIANAVDVSTIRSSSQGSLIQTPRTAIVFGASDTEKTLTIGADGLTHTIIVELPDWTVDRTATLSLLNADDKTLYSISALAENATYVLLVERPFHGMGTVKITLSGAPGGTGGTVYVTVYIK